MRLVKDWVFGDPILELNKSELATLRRTAAIAERAARMLGLDDDQRCEDDLGALAMYARDVADSTDPVTRARQ